MPCSNTKIIDIFIKLTSYINQKRFLVSGDNMTFNADMTTGARVGWYALKIIGFVVASYIFSYIFWSTKKCVEKGCKTKKKK